MLTLILKNETNNSYDSIRRAMKAAYKDSAAYRMRQVEFDDSLKSENTLQMKIGDYKAMNLQLTCTVTDVKQMSMVISDLLDEPRVKGKRDTLTDNANKVDKKAVDPDESNVLPAEDETPAENPSDDAIISTSETA